MSGTVRAVKTYAGDPAWHVTGYQAVRRLLTDPRLGRSHPDPDRAPRFSESVIFGRPQPATPTEAADHARMRKLLAPAFAPRRMAILRPRVQELVEGLLDELAEHTPPVDFHEAISFPLPALVICDLLGVPYEDREDFRRWSDDAADMGDQARSMSGLAALWQYMGQLVEAKRREPGDDLLSRLVTGQADGPEIPAEEAARLGAALLFAGHETTVAAIDKGMLLLLSHSGLAKVLQDQPALVDAAVEEILRLPLPVGTPEEAAAVGLPRWANADVDVEETTIRSGELVLLDLQGANLDDRAFPSPDVLDLDRAHNPHLSFGHGAHFCLGAPLARMELQVLFGALCRRFPTLRLAVPADQLRPRNHLLTGGLHSLPVAW